MLYNEKSSDNYNESYIENLFYVQNPFDRSYRFEGYKIFQVKHAGISRYELNNPDVAKEIFQTDVKNNAQDIYNWKPVLNTDTTSLNKYIWVPEIKVKGKNEGLNYSFSFKEDQFAQGDKTLINGKEYYFMTIAYAYNNWYTFDPVTQFGQKTPYLEGRSNIRLYTFRPDDNVKEKKIQVKVTRISGEGNPHTFLELEKGIHDKILSQNFDGKITYKAGFGPLDANFINQTKFNDKIYRLEISGNFNHNRNICGFDSLATWDLTSFTDNEVLLQNKPLSFIKEYVVRELGFSIFMHNHPDPGNQYNASNGGIGQTLEYKDKNGVKWFTAVTDGGKIEGYNSLGPLNFVKNYAEDPQRVLSNLGKGYFVPFLSAKFNDKADSDFFLSPAPREIMQLITSPVYNTVRLRDLNNVDIVFTSDKSKWSKCIVVETGFRDQTDSGFATIGNTKNFEVRNSPSVDKEGNDIHDGTLGFSYFPGYAIDVETGKRLNIFFGENSVYSGTWKNLLEGDNQICSDLI